MAIQGDAGVTSEAEIVREWMERVKKDKEWSSEHWARLAKTSPTNITRFLKNAEHVPSTRTIAKLSEVAGSAPMIGVAGIRPAANARTLSVVAQSDVPRLLKGDDVEPVGEVATNRKVSGRAFAFEVETAEMVLRGLAGGDIVLAEPANVVRPAPGDVVLYRGAGGAPRLGEFNAGGLVSHKAVEPIPAVRAAARTVIAVCLEVRRNLRPAPVSPQK